MSSDLNLKTACDDSRAVIRVEGPDAEALLQGLLTNNVARASSENGVYAALLTPQGKYLADMILTRPTPERFLLDVDADQATGLIQRLTMYKLRSRAEIAAEPSHRVVLQWSETGAVPAEAPGALQPSIPDPRDARLGRRAIAPDAPTGTDRHTLDEYDALRIRLGVPAAGLDLRPNDGFILENDFERLNGVDFRKGCYVGQEIVARMHLKTELKKGLRRLRLDGPARPGDSVTKDGKPAGVLGSCNGEIGLSVLRLDRIGDGAVEIGDSGAKAVVMEAL